MRIERIKLENFMSYKKNTVVDLSKLNLFAIVGDTGSGKSSLIDAICYALYGKITRTNSEHGVRTAIISKGATSYRVSLAFTIGKTRFVITRQGQEEGLEGIRIEENGKTLTSLTKKKEIDAYVENNIVGMTYDTFTRVIILPQGQFDKFLKPESPRERREILVDIMNLQAYRRIGDRAREDFELLKSRLNFLSERTKNLEEEKISSLELEKKKTELLTLKEKKEAVEEEKNLLATSIRKLEEVLFKLDTYGIFLKEEGNLLASSEEIKVEEDRLYIGKNLGGLKEGLDRREKYLMEITSAKAEIESILAGFSEKENSLIAKKGELQEKKYAFCKIDFEKIKESLMAELNKYQKYLALGTELVRQKNSISRLEEDLTKNETKISELNNKLALAEATSKKNGRELEQKTLERVTLEKLFLMAEATQKVQELQSNLAEGDICPICGTVIQSFNIQPVKGEELIKVRELRDRAETEKKRLYLLAIDVDKQLNSLNIGRKNAVEYSNLVRKNLEEIRGEFTATIKALTPEIVESEYPIVFCDKKINETNVALKENSLKEKKFSEEIDQLKENINEIEKRVESLKANVEVKKQIILSRKTDVLIFEKEWEEKVFKLGFKELEEAGAQSLTFNEINFLSEKVAKYSRDLTVISMKIKNVENEIGAYKKNSVEEIKNILETEKEKLEVVRKNFNLLEIEILEMVKKIQEAETMKQQMAALTKERTELEKKYYVLEKIQKDFSNKGLLPYVTSAILKDLVKKSNIYLHRLTVGKMALVLSGEDNLLIIEEGSAEPRSVNTLSGGETFLCSLAMALGLKDILTEDALINSFFIDEGFGTLDENMVQFVAETLVGLENDRNQIGIITHRRDLVEKFSDVLEVRKVRGVSIVEKIK